MSGFENGTALITGAGSGLGRATALEFAREGVRRFVLADISSARLDETAAQLAGVDAAVRVHAVAVDVRDAAGVERMVAGGAAAFGRIDYAVHCVGIVGAVGASTEQSDVSWDAVHDVGLKGVFLCQRAVVRQMRGQEAVRLANGMHARGAVVNIASIMGLVALGDVAPYVAAKHGVVGLTKSDAVAYAREHIRVNCVCPGFVRTNLMGEDMSVWEQFKPTVETGPMPRFGLAEEIAAAVVFLASGKASYITGIAMPVDGGYCCK